MSNLCKLCEDIQAPPLLVSNNICMMCSKPIDDPQHPAHLICKECSKENNLCQQCGMEIVK